jgi:predicted nicotinamide N-methyase
MHEEGVVAGKRVCDLGSGTGIGGLAAAVCGAESVLLTDILGLEFPGVLERIKPTLALRLPLHVVRPAFQFVHQQEEADIVNFARHVCASISSWRGGVKAERR